MNPTGYDDIGPRIDMDGLGPEPGKTMGGPAPEEPSKAPRPMAPPPAARPGRQGGNLAGLIGLGLGLIALVLAAVALFSTPEPQTGPAPSLGAVPGAEAERIAKLEKDVNALMLQFVTLEKEIKALGHKAGSVAKLTELNAQMQALIGRMEAVESQELDRKMENLSGSAKTETKAEEAAEPEEPDSGSQGSKVTYKVRSGDTLFKVARNHNVSTKQLAKWNNISNSSKLYIGQKLVIYKN